jgi:MGT family glycosyltransferase
MNSTAPSGRTVAAFCMPETGHFQRMLSVIHGLVERGMAVHVYTHSKFAPQVAQWGGVFHDLFSPYSLQLADDESMPVPCRFVTFAAAYGRQILREVAPIKPSLIIHDSFAVVGRLVAEQLAVPRVNVCSGHNMVPEHVLAELRNDPRVKIADKCWTAVRELQESFGMADASPFSYVSGHSQFMNLYCEPPEFLTEKERALFEPVAFIGSLPPSATDEPRGKRDLRGSSVEVYVSFGTVIWRYYKAIAFAALAKLAEAFSHIRNVKTVISLGGTELNGAELAKLTSPNVRIESYVNQWRVLREADLFVTHHGMNSTHEAIFHRTPMLSYPFFSDQPGLAAECQRLGVAIPLAGALRAPLGVNDVHAAFARAIDAQESMKIALERVRAWELATLTRRDQVWRWIELAETSSYPRICRENPH